MMNDANCVFWILGGTGVICLLGISCLVFFIWKYGSVPDLTRYISPAPPSPPSVKSEACCGCCHQWENCRYRTDGCLCRECERTATDSK